MSIDKIYLLGLLIWVTYLTRVLCVGESPVGRLVTVDAIVSPSQQVTRSKRSVKQTKPSNVANVSDLAHVRVTLREVQCLVVNVSNKTHCKVVMSRSLSAQFARVSELAAAANRQQPGEVDNSRRPLDRRSRQGRGRALGELIDRELNNNDAAARQVVVLQESH